MTQAAEKKRWMCPENSPKSDSRPSLHLMALKMIRNCIYLVGNLVENVAPFYFKSGIILNRTDSSGSLEEQGIYQGLVMTDAEKQRLGILRESIYMTANLEQWEDELCPFT